MDFRTRKWTLALLLFVLSVTTTLAEPAPSVYRNNGQSRDLEEAARHAMRNNEYGEAAALYLYALQVGPPDSLSCLNAARSLAMIGDRSRAFTLLQQAMDCGFRNTEKLLTDPKLHTLHDDARWNGLVQRCSSLFAAYKQAHADPRQGQWVTSDVDLFWRAYDLAMQVSPDRRPAIYQTEYLDRGSAGLRDFMVIRHATAQSLAEYVDKHPRFYATIRANTLQITRLSGQIHDIYRRMKALYGDAYFPNVYFCVGGFFGGGTVSDQGLLISAEMMSASPQVALNELNAWEKSVLLPVGEITPIVSHELVHFEQHFPADDESLLRQCIVEGGASFIGSLVCGRVNSVERRQHAYGDAHEKELWNEFTREMNGTDSKKWFHSSTGAADRPDDLGYWMGFKICQAYYRRAADKKKAVAGILNIQDFKSFLKASGYPDRMSSTPESAP